MKVSELMSTQICCVSPDSTVEKAAGLMKSADVGSIPVCEGGSLMGIITDRDIVVRTIAEGGGIDAPVKTAMTHTIYATTPDADVSQAMEIMCQKQVRRLPVVDGEENRRLVGMLSMADLARVNKLDVEVGKVECSICGE